MPRRSQSRQFTILSHKPTHFRVKTESDFKENSSSSKHLTIKKPLRTLRFNQFQSDEFSQKFSNQTLMGKKSPPQRSIFGEINPHAPKFKKQNIFPQEIEHPLKEYINTQKSNQSLRNIKRYKTACEPFTSVSKPAYQHRTMVPCRKFDSQSKPQLPKEKQTLYQLIDQIYKKINNFKQVGFTDKKINEWIQRYCFQRRKYMVNLLMKSQSKHKFTDSIENYIYERDPQKVKQKLLTVKKTINGKDRPIDQYDLAQFSKYIEEILIHKNKTKVFELKESISEKLQECFIYNRQRNQYQFGKKLHPPQLMNFVTDLTEVQKIYGNFKNISNFSRQYFIDLENTEKDIRTKIYDLIKINDGHKGIKPRQLTKSSTVKLQRKVTRQFTRQSQFKQIPNVIEVNDFNEQNLQ